MEPIGKQADLIELIKLNKKYILIEAPAGTGKTFSCIQGAKTVIKENMILKFQKVLILTFSRNARAQIMKELNKGNACNDIQKLIEINNYHSFFKKYLDSYSNLLGFKVKLKIISGDDLLLNLKELPEWNEKIFNKYKCNIIEDFHFQDGKLKLNNKKSKFAKSNITEVENLLNIIDRYSKDSGYICFEQFGKYIYDLINKFPFIAHSISHDFPVLILDEYQDTNYYQSYFVHSILKKSKGVFFADKWQMIYEFRGSTMDRLTELEKIYPQLVKIEFNEIHRYREKDDILTILNQIRNNMAPNYTSLENGRLIIKDIKCNQNWSRVKGRSHAAQCTIISQSVFYSCSKEITTLLNKNKSVAILTRGNSLANRLTKIFFEHKYSPRSLSDTGEMLLQNQLLKKCLQPGPIGEKLNSIITLLALCTVEKVIDGEEIEQLQLLTIDSNSRKRKPLIKKIWNCCKNRIENDSIEGCLKLIKDLLILMDTEGSCAINYVRKRYVEHCLSEKNLTEEIIDTIMLQRQYIDSFSDISKGLYITTIHQSKGKEFDCVFIIDIDDVQTDANLLYVSHSRMRELLFPVKLNYQGLRY